MYPKVEVGTIQSLLCENPENQRILGKPPATHRGAQMTPHYVFIPYEGRPTKWGIYQSKVEISHLSPEIRWDNFILLKAF